MDQIETDLQTSPSSPEEGEVLSFVDSLTPDDVSRMKAAREAKAALAAKEVFPAHIVQAWLRLGYGLVPLSKDATSKDATSKDGKGAVRKFGWFDTTERGHAEKCLSDWIDEGAYSSSPRAGLVLDGLQGGVPLVVVDLDVASMEGIVRARLPPTPLEVTTGREGGGRHFFYRRDPAGFKRGSHTLSTIGCDYKGYHGYVVCSGSVHHSGLIYKAYWNGQEIAPDSMSAEMLASLPVLPDTLVQELVDEDLQAKAAARAGVIGFHELDASVAPKGKGKGSKGTTASGMTRVDADDSAIIRHGVYKGMSAAQVAAKLGPGKHSICCPHEDHQSDKDGGTAASLHVSASGEAQRTVCWASWCSRTYNYGKGFGVVLPFPTKGKSKAKNTAFDVVTDEHGFTRVVLGEGYLDTKGRVEWHRLRKDCPDVMKRTTLVLQAGQGRGKTWLAQQLTKNLLSKKRVVVAVSPTRSLVADLSAKLGLPSYADSEGKIENSVAVCLPSLPRARSWRYEPGKDGVQGEIVEVGADLLVVDEIEQGVASLLGSHLDDTQARGAWDALVAHTASASSRLFMDADAGSGTRELLRQAKIDPDDVVWIEAPPAAPRAFEVYERTFAWRDILESAKTERLACAVQSLTEAHALAKAMPLYQDLPTLVVSQDTSFDVDLGKLNTILKDHGHLVYTPSLGTGVSIDLENWFSSVWLLTSDSVGTATSALQMACRVRHPVDPTLRICRLVRGRRPQAWEADPDQVIDVWSRREGKTLKAASFKREFPADLAVPADGRMILNVNAERYVKAMSVAHATLTASGKGQVTEALTNMLSSIGWSDVTKGDQKMPLVEAAQVSIVRSEARKEVKGEDVQSTVQAQDLDAEKLKTVRSRGPKSKSETLGLRRASLDRAYGPGAADDEVVVAWDNRGKKRGKMRAFAEVVAVMEGGVAREAVKAQDRRQLEAGVSSPRLNHRALKAAVRAHLVTRVFDPVGALIQHFSIYTSKPSKRGGSQPLPICPDKAKALVVYLRTKVGRELAQIAGFTLRSDAEDNPITAVSSLMGTVGLKLSSRRKRGEDEVTRTYGVCVPSLKVMQERAAHYLGQLRAGTPTEGEGEDEDLQALVVSMEAEQLAQAVLGDLKAA